MRYSIILFLSFLMISVSAQSDLDKLFTIPVPQKANFQLDINVVNIEDDQYCLIVDLRLIDRSYTYSPFSNDSFYLPFTISLVDKNDAIKVGTLQEFPSSFEEFDPIIEAEVRFIRQDTRFKQRFIWDTNVSNQTKGIIEFLLEPSCIPYDVDFDLEFKDGEVSIKNIITSISPEYKG